MWRRVCSVERAHYKRDLELGALDLAGGHHHEVTRAARHGQRVYRLARSLPLVDGEGDFVPAAAQEISCVFFTPPHTLQTVCTGCVFTRVASRLRVAPLRRLISKSNGA